MRLTESYLSRVARRAWPDALVTVEQTESRNFQNRTQYRLEREGAGACELGKTFYEAQSALVAELRSALTTSELRAVPRRLTGHRIHAGEPPQVISAKADLLGAVGAAGMEHVACIYMFRTEPGQDFERIHVPTTVPPVDYCFWVRCELNRRWPTDRFTLEAPDANPTAREW